MFERIFKSAMHFGSRILFCSAIVVAVLGIFSIFAFLSMPGISLMDHGRGAVGVLYSTFVPAAYLLFGALLVDRADRIIERLRA